MSQPSTHQRKVIIIGATSGIGASLSKELAKRNYLVGITGKREDQLQAVASEISTKTHYVVMDVSQIKDAQMALMELINEMGGMDIIVINAGVSNYDLAWEKQKEIIEVNILGFAAMAAAATAYFLKKGRGHIVGVSSISGLRGFAQMPVYSASKAFISTYLDGLRARLAQQHTSIYVTDIQPGLVDTAMGQMATFWRSTPEKAATQIADAIEKKTKRAYITKRWRLVAWVFKLLPDFLFYPLLRYFFKER